MKIAILLQVLAVLSRYQIVNAIFGFGDKPEDPDRIRIYLEEDEKLLVPKNSKIEYISPVIDMDEEIILDKPPSFSTYVTKVVKKPLSLPPQPYYSKSVAQLLYEKPVFTIEDLKLKSEPETNYFGGYLGENAHDYRQVEAALLQQQAKHQSPFAYGKLLKPIVLFPNGWIQGVNIEGTDDVKPVTEDQPDDIKYDFRTKTHSLR